MEVPVAPRRMVDLRTGSGPRDVAEMTDGELIACHRSGNGDAFHELYGRYQRRLVEFCAARTGDRHEAEDLANETFLRVLIYVDSIHADRRTLWPWLRTTASRLIINGHHAMVSDLWATGDLAGQELPRRALVAEADIEWAEWRMLIGDAIGQLPTRQQIALRLFYGHDWTAADSGRSMGLGRPAFRQLVLRARRNLRAQLTGSPNLGVALLAPLVERVRSASARVRSRMGAAQQATGAALVAADGIVQSLAVVAVVAGLSAGMADAPADAPMSGSPLPAAVTAAWSEPAIGAPRITAPVPEVDMAATAAEVTKDASAKQTTTVVAPLRNPVDEDAEASVVMSSDDQVVTVEEHVWMTVPPHDEEASPIVVWRTELYCDGPGADMACEILRTVGDLLEP